MLNFNNLDNFHYVIPKSHYKIIFDNGTIVPSLIKKDIIREGNVFYKFKQF